MIRGVVHRATYTGEHSDDRSFDKAALGV
jgi:hypothetical protein